MNTYGHLFPDSLEQTTTALDRLFGAGQAGSTQRSPEAGPRANPVGARERSPILVAKGQRVVHAVKRCQPDSGRAGGSNLRVRTRSCSAGGRVAA